MRGTSFWWGPCMRLVGFLKLKQNLTYRQSINMTKPSSQSAASQTQTTRWWRRIGIICVYFQKTICSISNMTSMMLWQNSSTASQLAAKSKSTTALSIPFLTCHRRTSTILWRRWNRVIPRSWTSSSRRILSPSFCSTSLAFVMHTFSELKISAMKSRKRNSYMIIGNQFARIKMGLKRAQSRLNL